MLRRVNRIPFHTQRRRLLARPTCIGWAGPLAGEPCPAAPKRTSWEHQQPGKLYSPPSLQFFLTLPKLKFSSLECNVSITNYAFLSLLSLIEYILQFTLMFLLPFFPVTPQWPSLIPRNPGSMQKWRFFCAFVLASAEYKTSAKKAKEQSEKEKKPRICSPFAA